MKLVKTNNKKKNASLLLFFTFSFVLSQANADMTSVSKEQWYKTQVENSQRGEPGTPSPAEEMHSEFESTNAPIYQTKTNYKASRQYQDRSYTIGVLGGGFNYPQVSNMDVLSGVGGIQLGAYLWRDLILTGGFLYTFQQSDINRLTRTDQEDIDHYMFSAGLGYDLFKLFSFLPQWSSGQLGYVINHSRRQYNADENASQGWDQGVYASIGAEVFDQVQVSFEYRYLTNIEYNVEQSPRSQDRQLQRAVNSGQTRELESFDYQLFLLKAEYLF